MKLKILFLFILFQSCNPYQKCDFQTFSNYFDWHTDIEYIRNELPKKHKNLFFAKSEEDFNNGLNKIIKQLDTLTDFETAVKLQILIASFGDSHSGIAWHALINKDLNLPIATYWFSDGLYIIKASIRYKNLLGLKINKINNHPVSEISDSLSTLISIDNKALVKNFVPKAITFTQLLDYFSFSKNGAWEFELEDTVGNIYNINITPSSNNKQIVEFKPNNLPYCWQNRYNDFSLHYFKNNQILYVMYNKCKSFPQKQIFEILDSKNIEKLIFDMRFNSGGNSYYGEKFVRKLKKNNINKKGKLFVVIGRKTFSSAILNVFDFRNNTQAIIIGENTGGKPNHFGEVRCFKLPVSQLTVFYSTKYFVNSDTDLNTITPDVLIETSFKNYSEGIDPVFEWIKDY